MNGRASSAAVGLVLLGLAVALAAGIGTAPAPSLYVVASMSCGAASLSYLGRAVRRS